MNAVCTVNVQVLHAVKKIILTGILFPGLRRLRNDRPPHPAVWPEGVPAGGAVQRALQLLRAAALRPVPQPGEREERGADGERGQRERQGADERALQGVDQPEPEGQEEEDNLLLHGQMKELNKLTMKREENTHVILLQLC